MADFPWSRELVLQALRERLLGGGGVTEGFTGLDVRPALPGEPTDGSGHEHVVVVLRWRQDPCLYALAFPLRPDGADDDPSRPPGVSTGLPVVSLEDWVVEVLWSLMEELDTGLVRRATRTRVGDVTFLSTDEATDVRPKGYHLGDVHLGPTGDAGGHLADVGLDVAVARRAHREGRLLTWVWAYRDVRDLPAVGHAAVATPEPHGPAAGPARLEVLEVVPGTPPTVAAALAYAAVRDAVEAGAAAVTSDLDDLVLDEVGLRREEGSESRSVTWQDVQKPVVRRSSARTGTA
ncbi:hypothetical protein WDZ17_16540 [Pseudokineococcus basanitobsidens]|uniref:Suppressor of fused protein SUFU n=1 Tax=Pseudokineococcus basanitobsidens TaxID=1926649 RepID=A0ABU8RPB4_9ACTN